MEACEPTNADKESTRGLGWDEAANVVSRDGLSKNAWKRAVRDLIYQSRKTDKAPRSNLDRSSPGKKARLPARATCLWFDCSFDHMMSQKQLHSLSDQLKDSMSANRRIDRPCHFMVFSPDESPLRAVLARRHFADRWQPFVLTNQDLMLRKRVIYLTSDSTDVLDEIEEGSTVVIGGLVDRNHHKGLTHRFALDKKIETRRLPLDSFRLKGCKLTCNQVAEILCLYLDLRDSGLAAEPAWHESADKILPKYKRLE